MFSEKKEDVLFFAFFRGEMEANDFLDFCEEFVVFFFSDWELCCVFLVCVKFGC